MLVLICLFDRSSKRDRWSSTQNLTLSFSLSYSVTTRIHWQSALSILFESHEFTQFSEVLSGYMSSNVDERSKSGTHS
jgi:hypothetical protein